MRVRISRVLFLGAILSATAVAQSTTPAPEPHSVDVSLMYNGLRSNGTSTGPFWMRGGSFQAYGQVWRTLGIAGDFTGEHVGHLNSAGTGLNLVTVTAGPRITVHRRIAAVYGQMLFGAAHGFDGMFPAIGGTEAKASSLALQGGGGMDVEVRRRVAVRAFEVNWLRTQLPNSTTGVQNNLIIAAGVVIRIR